MIQHSWDVSPSQARAIQIQLKGAVILQDQFASVHRVAGIDVGFEAGNTITRAAVVVLGFPSLELLEQTVARRPTAFPYIPGLLSFREIPAVLDALQQLRLSPDLLLCDGQGVAHPRRLGIASHLGVLTGLPSIGVAKSRLVGIHGELAEDKGAWTPLVDKQEVIGAVLRSRRGVKPLYISPGHKITLPTALDYVMRCVTRYRLPETTRLAHRLASG